MSENVNKANVSCSLVLLLNGCNLQKTTKNLSKGCWKYLGKYMQKEELSLGYDEFSLENLCCHQEIEIKMTWGNNYLNEEK